MWYFRLVKGKSMLPSYRSGQTVLVLKTRNFKIGDVVVAYMHRREVIKRITRINKGHIYLEGDNPHASTDSRQLGWVVDHHVLGKVIWPKKRRPVKKH